MTTPSVSGRLLFLALWSALGLALAAAACGDSGGDGGGPCAADAPPAECSTECTDDRACPDGFHCGGGGTCTAECTAGGGECASGEQCDDRGSCVSDGGGGGGCPSVEVDLAPVVPTVILLIDRSGSMIDDQFGDFTDRWTAVGDALTNQATGVLWAVESKIVLGATLYTSDDGNAGGTCPELVTVAPAVDNAAAIRDLIAQNPPPDSQSDTPTAESITATVSSFPSAEHRVLVLATDGDPDRCDDADAHDQASQHNSEAAVQAAFTQGIATFVLSVGSDATEEHLRRLARAGLGQDLEDGTAEPTIANSPGELVSAFENIIHGVRSCEIQLDGRVNLDQASGGTVVLNGDALEYGAEWTMKDEDTLLLVGAACETFLATDEVSLSAEFPCGVVVD